MAQSSRIACSLVLAGWVLPFAAVGLFLLVSRPGHSEDYGWGLLAIFTALFSCLAAGVLMWWGVFYRATITPKTKSIWVFLVMGVLGLGLLLLSFSRLVM